MSFVDEFKKYINNVRDSGLNDLVESIGPVPTDYGLNLKNKKWSDVIDIADFITRKTMKLNGMKGDMRFTFFKEGDTFYQVYFIKSKGWHELGFAAAKKFNFEDPLSVDNIENFALNRINDSRAYKVFNRVFYIALEGLVALKINKVAFKGSDPYLGNLYTALMAKKSLPKILEKYGFDFSGETNEGYFIFERKAN